MTQAQPEDIHAYSKTSIAAGVHLLYAVSVESVPPSSAGRGDRIPAEMRAQVTEIVRGQGGTDLDLERIFAHIGASLELLESGAATTFTKDAYDAARDRAVAGLRNVGVSGHRVWPPTSQTVRKRLGSNYWNDALRALGYPVSGRGRARGAARYSPEQFRASVSEFLTAAAEQGTASSFTAYEDWRAAEQAAGRPRPSGAGLRAHFGGWQAAKDSTGQ